MVSSATVLTNPNPSRVIEIITSENPANCSHALAKRLCSRMKLDGLDASLTTWQSHQPVANIIHLVVDCEQDPMLVDPTPERFSQIVDLLTRPSNVLWLSWCSNQDHERNPETALINGLARSAHAENQALRLVTLDIQQKFNLDNCSGLLPIVCNLVSRSFCPAGSQIILQEREYVYRDATLLIPRVMANKELDQSFRSQSDRQDVVSLDKDGAYLIAGGLGDIGMRLCKLMARKGAGHIIILSRRREDLKLARSIEHSLQAISADVTFHWRTCDISIEREVRECVEGLSSSGIPRVKGVVQAAVVLKVSGNARTQPSTNRGRMERFRRCQAANLAFPYRQNSMELALCTRHLSIHHSTFSSCCPLFPELWAHLVRQTTPPATFFRMPSQGAN